MCGLCMVCYHILTELLDNHFLNERFPNKWIDRAGPIA